VCGAKAGTAVCKRGNSKRRERLKRRKTNEFNMEKTKIGIIQN
jgi:hypothetical protein